MACSRRVETILLFARVPKDGSVNLGVMQAISNATRSLPDEKVYFLVATHCAGSVYGEHVVAAIGLQSLK